MRWREVAGRNRDDLKEWGIADDWFQRHDQRPHELHAGDLSRQRHLPLDHRRHRSACKAAAESHFQMTNALRVCRGRAMVCRCSIAPIGPFGRRGFSTASTSHEKSKRRNGQRPDRPSLGIARHSPTFPFFCSMAFNAQWKIGSRIRLTQHPLEEPPHMNKIQPSSEATLFQLLGADMDMKDRVPVLVDTSSIHS